MERRCAASSTNCIFACAHAHPKTISHRGSGLRPLPTFVRQPNARCTLFALICLFLTLCLYLWFSLKNVQMPVRRVCVCVLVCSTYAAMVSGISLNIIFQRNSRSHFFSFLFPHFPFLYWIAIGQTLSVCCNRSAVLKLRKLSPIRAKWATRKYIFRFTCLSMRLIHVTHSVYGITCDGQCTLVCIENAMPIEFKRNDFFFFSIIHIRTNDDTFTQSSIVNEPWKSTFCRITAWLVCSSCALTQSMTTAFLSKFIQENKKK